MADRKIKIAHLYPEVLNLYGDRGNILCLKKRLEWRGIECEVTEVKLGDNQDLTDYDIFFIGGGQDFEQEVLLNVLRPAAKLHEPVGAVLDAPVAPAAAERGEAVGPGRVALVHWDLPPRLAEELISARGLNLLELFSVDMATTVKIRPRACVIRISSVPTATDQSFRRIQHLRII